LTILSMACMRNLPPLGCSLTGGVGFSSVSGCGPGCISKLNGCWLDSGWVEDINVEVDSEVAWYAGGSLMVPACSELLVVCGQNLEIDD